MEDKDIIQLYENRSEEAISETSSKYGSYLNTITYNILKSHEDSEECVQDAYMKTWNAIPPAKPDSLKAFIARIARNTAIDRFNRETALKRGGSETALIFDEIAETIAKPSSDPEDAVIATELSELLNELLKGLSEDSRNIFVLRYYHMYATDEIAKMLGFTGSKVRTSLNRTRVVLKELLQKEGY